MAIPPKSRNLEEHRAKESSVLEAIAAWAVRMRQDINCDTALENMAGGAIARIPGWVRALTTLFRYGLQMEADAIARPVVETAIVLMWVGSSEERAQYWCSRCAQKVAGWVQGMRDAGADVSPRTVQFAAEFQQQFPMPAGFNSDGIGLETMATETKDKDARGLARSLYFYSYGRLCGAAHADQLSGLQAFYGLKPGRISAYADALVGLRAILECAPPLLTLEVPRDLIGRVHETLEAGKEL